MQITKERLKQYIKSPLDNGLTRSEQMEMARQLLASIEQEPVAYIDPFTFKNFAAYRDGETGNKRMGREWVWAKPDTGLIPLYAAPQLPQPAVIDFGALTKRIVHRLVDYGAADDDAISSAEEFVYNACRAAMLQGAEPVRGEHEEE